MSSSSSFGPYRLETVIARGGTGDVYRALDGQGRRVALKLLRAGRTATAAQRRRFLTEVQTHLRLRHPHVVPLLDAGEVQGLPYLALEWIEGRSLEERLVADGPLTPREAASLVKKLAQALAHCHGLGVLHRDLKPGNVLLRAASQEPLLTDFGLARDLEEGTLHSASPTQEGRWMGTPGFWPPEQARGERAAIGPRSDVYGLGGLLYACLTGQPPHEGSSIPELLLAATRLPRPPSGLTAGVPPALEALCLRCLDPDAARRPASAAALAGELEDWLERRGARPASPRSVLLAGGCLLALGLVGAWAARPSPSPPRAGGAAAAGGSRGQPLAAESSAAPARWEVMLDRPAIPDSRQASEAGAALLGLASEEAPVDSAQLHLRATDLMRQGEPQGALAVWTRALVNDPGDRAALAGRAATRRLLGDVQGAEDDLTRLIELTPQAPGAWGERGYLRLERGQLPGALSDLEQAVSLAPGDPHMLGQLAVARARSGNLPGALRMLDRAVELAPRDATVACARAVARAQAGDREGALEDLDRAVALRPRDALLRLNRGAVRERGGDVQAALEDLDQAVALRRDWPAAHYNRGLARVKAGDLQGAREDFDRALALDPRLGEAWAQRGYLRDRQGEREGARADLERALELAPDASWADDARAHLAAAEGATR